MQICVLNQKHNERLIQMSNINISKALNHARKLKNGKKMVQSKFL